MFRVIFFLLKVNPKYLKLLTSSIFSPFQIQSSFFFFPFLIENHHFCFITFNFESLFLKNLPRVSNISINATLCFANITLSSAYANNNQILCLPTLKSPIPLFLNSPSMSIYKLKREELITHPCLTPLVNTKFPVSPFPVLFFLVQTRVHQLLYPITFFFILFSCLIKFLYTISFNFSHCSSNVLPSFSSSQVISSVFSLNCLIAS